MGCLARTLGRGLGGVGELSFERVGRILFGGMLLSEHQRCLRSMFPSVSSISSSFASLCLVTVLESSVVVAGLGLPACGEV